MHYKLLFSTLMLISCIKQENFQPKHRNEEVIIVYMDIGKKNYEFSKFNLGGEKVYFNPGEIEAYLFEDEVKSYKGVFSGTTGFQDFLGFQKVKPGSSYRLEIRFNGDTLNAYTRCVPDMENYITGVEYESLRYGKPFVRVGNTNKTTFYSVSKGTNLFDLGNLEELKTKDNYVKNGGNIVFKDQGFYPSCEFYPYFEHFQILRVTKLPLDELRSIYEHRELNQNVDAPNPFLIPYNLNFEVEKDNLYLDLVCTQDTQLLIPIVDISENVLEFEVKDKSGSKLDLMKNHVGFEIKDYVTNENYYVGSSIDTLNMKAYVSFNSFTRKDCDDRSVTQNQLIGRKYQVQGVVNNQGIKTSSLQFSLKEGLNRLILYLE